MSHQNRKQPKASSRQKSPWQQPAVPTAKDFHDFLTKAAEEKKNEKEAEEMMFSDEFCNARIAWAEGHSTFRKDGTSLMVRNKRDARQSVAQRLYERNIVFQGGQGALRPFNTPRFRISIDKDDNVVWRGQAIRCTRVGAVMMHSLAHELICAAIEDQENGVLSPAVTRVLQTAAPHSPTPTALALANIIALGALGSVAELTQPHINAEIDQTFTDDQVATAKELVKRGILPTKPGALPTDVVDDNVDRATQIAYLHDAKTPDALRIEQLKEEQQQRILMEALAAAAKDRKKRPAEFKSQTPKKQKRKRWAQSRRSTRR